MALDPFEIDDQLALMPQGEKHKADGALRSLAEDFVAPTFTVLDRKQGYWQDRARAWMSLGIQSELGRSQDLHSYGESIHKSATANTSVFDPVLCEIAYRWFCGGGGHVLDPFAGGSVRGVVAAALGYAYAGIDLRPEQVEANRRQAGVIFGPDGVDLGREVVQPRWFVGSSAQLTDMVEGPFDLVFTCPPYADLERYSDDPGDLSVMPYPLFLAAYRYIIAQSVHLLRDDRFVVFVVGDVRDKSTGTYRDLIGETVRAFEAAGAGLYNSAVIVQPSGSAPMRANQYFHASRKLVTLHQHLLVFVKGDGRAAARAAS